MTEPTCKCERKWHFVYQMGMREQLNPHQFDTLKKEKETLDSTKGPNPTKKNKKWKPTSGQYALWMYGMYWPFICGHGGILIGQTWISQFLKTYKAQKLLCVKMKWFEMSQEQQLSYNSHNKELFHSYYLQRQVKMLWPQQFVVFQFGSWADYNWKL